MTTSGLFAERFAVAPDTDDDRGWNYDEAKGYNVAADGRPYVTSEITASTSTGTFVRAEQADSDRPAWDDPRAGVGTRTTAKRDTDRG